MSSSSDRGRRRPRLLGRDAERDALERTLADVLNGQSRVLVLRGEAGIGKTALLNQLADGLDGWRVARAVGVESELELGYSGLHQLCFPMLDEVEQLPEPQRRALATVFGLSAGTAPDPFMVGLATLTLIGDLAEQQPLLCIVDDAHWLDQASAQAISIVARRLQAERVALVCAARTGIGDHVLAGLPEMRVAGLADRDARALLLGHSPGPLDAAMYGQLIAESHGNPLALLELARVASVATGGLGPSMPAGHGVAGRIEHWYGQRLDALPLQTRLLVLAAAAEPAGDLALLERAGEILGIEMAALDPAIDAELIDVGAWVEFAHPLVRSAAYGRAGPEDRLRVHGALAEATDPERDPDRRAWHRARAASKPDDEVADELERSALRVRARGGVGAAAALLSRAVELTPDRQLRATRGLTTAQMSLQAGAFDAALAAIEKVEDGILDESGRAQADLLRGHLAVVTSYGNEAIPMLLRAAKRLESLDLELARRAYLMAWGATVTAGHLGEPNALLEICRAVRALPPLPDAAHPLELLIDGLTLVVTDGRAIGAPVLQRAAQGLAELSVEDVVQWGWIAPAASAVTWDFDRYGAIFERQARLVRDAGVLAELPQHLTGLAWQRMFAGDLGAARLLLAEIDSITAATGTPLPPFAALRLRSLQGREADVVSLIESTKRQAIAARQGLAVTTAHWAAAVLYNGLARYEEAAAAAAEVAADALAPFMVNFALPELVEAAARRGDAATAAAALQRLVEATTPTQTDWAVAVETRCRALLAEGDEADEAYRDSIDRFSRTQLRPELARTYLLHGEWLRREGRRDHARGQLRIAHHMFVEMGMDAFAGRAAHELGATGEKVRRHNAESRVELTEQEEQIARLARGGLSNREIGATLFLSNRTVEWHLRKVFTKLGIGSRDQLRATLHESVKPPASPNVAISGSGVR